MRADPVDALRRQLERHPSEIRPLQHAVAQFHLGNALLERGDLEGAEAAFTEAAALFELRGAAPERAKALNGLGATLRVAGRLPLAARAFAHAAAGLGEAELPLEEGAARFNLALVLAQGGRDEAAEPELARALELLDAEQVPGQAAAAARELGAVRVRRGELEAAEPVLRRAVELADRAGDVAGRGAAHNTLGLVELATDRPSEATGHFAEAVAANPRTTRPESFAMGQANLALALERSGAAPAARLAARQALSVPEAAGPVREQAAAVLERLGPGAADLRAVYEEAGDEGRARLARDELARAAAGDDDAVAASAAEWTALIAATELDAAGVAEVWLGALLELPPADLERFAAAAVAAAVAAGGETLDTFRGAVSRAMVRFGIPQWMRLQDVFSHAARAAGDAGSWR